MALPSPVNLCGGQGGGRLRGQGNRALWLLLFLCSDAASWITGQTYPVNGGYSFAI